MLCDGALRAHYRNRTDVHVRSDVFICHRNGDPEAKTVPEVFEVCGDVQVPQPSHGAWVTGMAPQLVMEVAPRSTHMKDRDEKRGTYEGMCVLEYWRFDPAGTLFRPPEYGERVLGQRLGPSGRYEPIEPGQSGWARSEVLELDFCDVDSRLGFWDYRQNRFLASHTEAEEARRSAEAENVRLGALLAVARGKADPGDQGR